MKYICSICGYVYDEASEGTAFADLPDSWVCPLCRAAKDLFRPEKTEAAPEPARPAPAAAGPSAHVDTDQAGEDLHKLSAGELSALCSNLARGCEKQYKNEEAGLFREIAAYFAAVTPDEPDGDLTHLLSVSFYSPLPRLWKPSTLSRSITSPGTTHSRRIVPGIVEMTDPSTKAERL